ncbi:MAG: cytochrome c3 family protein [Pseudomonadota bacterium]|nr:cytochrome c3 family protein [Pseudomonadota bacterium]
MHNKFSYKFVVGFLHTLPILFLAFSIISCKPKDKSNKDPNNNSMSMAYNKGYTPDQPIDFDHTLHAGVNKIPCLYCHANAPRSRHATVPSLNICMNCHIQVATDRPEIKKLQDHFNNDRAVVWNKVHLLPDFVMFNHKPHVRKGIACQSCHGPVESMAQVKQFSDLSMGWCVDCHRRNNAPLNCTTCHH